MSVRSMTGFARVRDTAGAVEIVISVKSVNHRGLDLHFYMPPEMDPFENAMRAAIKRHVSRGHLDIRVQITRAGSGAAAGVDLRKLDAYIEAFRAGAERYGLVAHPDLNAALRIPGILSDTAAVDLPESFEAPAVALLERALEKLNEFRSREGADLARVMTERNAAIHDAAVRMEQLREGAVPAFHARLRDRLAELLNGSNIDPQRLAHEAAMLADRGDIGEEISRLRIHSRQVDEILAKSGDVGKKLDFMLQEMNRETNTVLSKTAGLGDQGLAITELALAAKSDIEKIREQSLNLE